MAALLGAHLVSILLFLARSADADNPRYWFLIWNSFLGLVPLVLAWCLMQYLTKYRWLSWQNLALTLLWVSFLPNSFYMVSDLIHLHQTVEVSLLYDAVMFTSFITNGFLAGFLSVYLVHRQLLRRFSAQSAHALIGAVFLLCGFAIYLGRFLRWNSWDLFLHPVAVLFDITSSFMSPSNQGLLGTTLGVFLLLSSTYAVAWAMVRAVRAEK